jgi:hypothetical protein
MMPARIALRRVDDSLVISAHYVALTARQACWLPIAFQLKAARKAAAKDYSL